VQTAVIGWGSLIWRPGTLKLKTRWYKDGPILPVELARLSNGDRLTLVLHSGSSNQVTLWAVADSEALADAREDLHQREGTKNKHSIHYGTQAGEYSPATIPCVKIAISQWLQAHPRIDACVWTGLGCNWQEKRGREFSAEDAVRYLLELQDPSGAREYIQKAPSQIQTEVRRTIRAQLGWFDADLPPELFEP
jgi:hypothetical protein